MIRTSRGGFDAHLRDHIGCVPIVRFPWPGTRKPTLGPLWLAQDIDSLHEAPYQMFHACLAPNRYIRRTSALVVPLAPFPSAPSCLPSQLRPPSSRNFPPRTTLLKLPTFSPAQATPMFALVQTVKRWVAKYVCDCPPSSVMISKCATAIADDVLVPVAPRPRSSPAVLQLPPTRTAAPPPIHPTIVSINTVLTLCLPLLVAALVLGAFLCRKSRRSVPAEVMHQTRPLQ